MFVRQVCQKYRQDYQSAADYHSGCDQVTNQQISKYTCEYRLESVNDRSVAGTNQFDAQAVQQDCCEGTDDCQQEHEFELFAILCEKRFAAQSTSAEIEYRRCQQYVSCSYQRVGILEIIGAEIDDLYCVANGACQGEDNTNDIHFHTRCPYYADEPCKGHEYSDYLFGTDRLSAADHFYCQHHCREGE